MGKSHVYEREKAKLEELFNNVEDNQKELVQGLVEDAAFLYAENYELKSLIDEVGMVKVHPTNKKLQKQTEVGKQYIKNLNSYAIVIKTLNTILTKNAAEKEDEFDKFIQEMREQ